MKFRSERIWPLLKENNKCFWENNFFNWIKSCLNSSWNSRRARIQWENSWKLSIISNFNAFHSKRFKWFTTQFWEVVNWMNFFFVSFHWWPSPINSKIFQYASRPGFPLEFHSELHYFFHSIVKLVYSASSNCEALIGTHCS